MEALEPATGRQPMSVHAIAGCRTKLVFKARSSDSMIGCTSVQLVCQCEQSQEGRYNRRDKFPSATQAPKALSVLGPSSAFDWACTLASPGPRVLPRCCDTLMPFGRLSPLSTKCRLPVNIRHKARLHSPHVHTCCRRHSFSHRPLLHIKQHTAKP